MNPDTSKDHGKLQNSTWEGRLDPSGNGKPIRGFETGRPENLLYLSVTR